MSFRSAAMLMALAIYSVDEKTGRRPGLSVLEDSLYTASEGLNLPDETKANVYAMLAENLTEDTKFANAVDYIEYALGKAHQ